MRVILLVFICCIFAETESKDTLSIIADVIVVYATSNKPATLSCTIMSPHLTNFTWLKEGYEVSEKNVDNSTTNFRWNNETHGTMELHFSRVTPNDYGIYACTANKFNRTTRDYVQLSKYPCHLIWTVGVRKPESVHINWEFKEGYKHLQTSLFRIEYRESGTNQWLRTALLSTPERIVPAGSLDITVLKPSTVYEIKGVLSRQSFHRVLRTAFSTWVTTFEPKRIIPESDYVLAESNERAVLSCDVTGDQMTEFTWPRVSSFAQKYSTNVRWNSKTHVTMELEFASVTPDDNGYYTCQARSSGHLVSAISILVVKKFDFVRLNVGAIGTDGIYIVWNYTNMLGEPGDDDNTYVKFIIKYKESGTNQWHQAGQIFNSSIDPATGHYVIRKLENRTLYQIKNIVQICGRQFHVVLKTLVLSRWATTFEKDVEDVLTVWIVNKTMDAVTIQWSQPPPQLREYIDAYLISVENGNEKEKHFRWQKYKAADRDQAVVYLTPSISYDLVVRACFGDYCPDRHASAIMKVVMTNDTAGRDHLRSRRKSESDEFSVMTMKVTRDAENTTVGSSASFTCSVSVQEYEGWWTKKGERITSSIDSDDEIDWTIIVGDAEEGNTRDYTCVAKITNDSHTRRTMLVTVIPPTEKINVEAETVYAKPLEPTALSCDFFGYQLSNLKWHKDSDHNFHRISGVSGASSLTKTHIRMMLYFANTSSLDAEKYTCQATNIRLKKIMGFVQLEVSDQTPLQLSASVIGSKLVHLRWFDSYSRGDTHLVRSSENGSFQWKDIFSVQAEEDKKYNGYAVKQLTRGTSYWFEIVVISAGRRLASTYSNWITPTEKDLVYFPNITVIVKTTNSITIEWPRPPKELRAYIQVYRISVDYTYNGSKIVGFGNTTETYYIVQKLYPSTSHNLEVRACFVDLSTDCYSSDVQRGVFTKSTDKEFGTQVGTWVAVTGILFLLFVLGFQYLYKKAKKRRIVRERLAYFYSDKPIFFNPELAISDQADLLPYEKKWEFPRKLLKLDEELGRGSFGIVWKARAKTIRRPEVISLVAVKTVRPTAGLRCMKALFRELKILIYLGHHPNIVSLLGACTKDLDYGQLLVIVEFCRFGNLHDYLWRCRSKFVNELDIDSEKIPDSNSDADVVDVKSNSPKSVQRQGDASSMTENSSDSVDHPDMSTKVEDLTTGSDLESAEVKPLSKYPGDFANAELDPVRTQDLVSWAWQISRGMQYLADKKVLHGDLAARNVLLLEDNIVKICDFGLSKSLQEDDNCKDEGNNPLPVKWMAIESLRDGILSVKSDVWSFGVVLWELFSLAKTPYPEINPENMCETLVGGYRMAQSKYAPKGIYRMMLQCWEAYPSNRPTFDELECSIGNMVEKNVRMHYVELYTRCAKVYAEITNFRDTRAADNHDPSALQNQSEPTNSSQGIQPEAHEMS